MINLLLQNIDKIIYFLFFIMIAFLMLKLRKSMLDEKEYYKKRNDEILQKSAIVEKQSLDLEIISLNNKLKQLESENNFLKNLLLKDKKTENSTVNLKLFQNISQASNGKEEQESRLRAEIIDLEARANNTMKERDFLLKHIEDEKKESKKNPFFAISDK